MSQDAYRPPAAPIADSPRGPRAGTGRFEIGRCLSEAWSGTWSNLLSWLGIMAIVAAFALVIGGMFAIFAVGGISSFFVGLPLIALVLLGIGPILYWGTIRFSLNAIDGSARAADLFSVLTVPGGWTKMLGLTLLTGLLSMPGGVLNNALARTGESALIYLGFVVSVFWNLLMCRFYLAPAYLVDHQGALGPIAALRRAWGATRGQWLKLIALLLLTFPIMVAGFLAALVGLIPALLMCTLFLPSAYRQIEGDRQTEGDPAEPRAA